MGDQTTFGSPITVNRGVLTTGALALGAAGLVGMLWGSEEKSKGDVNANPYTSTPDQVAKSGEQQQTGTLIQYGGLAATLLAGGVATYQAFKYHEPEPPKMTAEQLNASKKRMIEQGHFDILESIKDQNGKSLWVRKDGAENLTPSLMGRAKEQHNKLALEQSGTIDGNRHIEQAKHIQTWLSSNYKLAEHNEKLLQDAGKIGGRP